MIACYCCTNEYDPGDTAPLEYNGADYHVCPSCIESRYRIIESGVSGRLAPSNVAESQIAYRATSSMPRSNPVLYLDDDQGYETLEECDECGSFFYGEMCCIDGGVRYVCQRCAENNYFYYDGEWHEHEEESDVSYNDDREERGYHKLTGDATGRFLSDYYVGFEFEHAPVRQGRRSASSSAELFYHIHENCGILRGTFEEHHDGSIASLGGYAAREIVSSPASGHMIDAVIEAFYAPFASGVFSPGPEHPSCGFHMHVSSRVLQRLKKDNNLDAFAGCRTDMVKALAAMADICSEYISSSRRKNAYCNQGPSVREKSLSLRGSRAMIQIYGAKGYPSIAIRTIGTIEYRLWPSSNSIRYTKARAELSQKLTAYYDSCFMAPDGQILVDEAALDRLHAAAAMCKPIKRTGLAAELDSMLNLSEATWKSLQSMSQRFNPFSYGQAHFRCSDAQLACLASEPSEASTDYINPMGVISAGDTTSTCISNERGEPSDVCDAMYISFGTGVKCYPATGDGDQLLAITKLANGEI